MMCDRSIRPRFLLLMATFWIFLLLVSRASEAQEASGLQLAMAMEQVLVKAIERAEKSVVAIARVPTDDPESAPLAGDNQIPWQQQIFRRPERPGDRQFIPRHFGTGVVVDRNGLILTQAHLLEPGDEHWVTTGPGEHYQARIRAADPKSGLAVLQIEARDLTPIRFGDGGRARRGQIVIALGNPYAIADDGQASASWGIVANVGRKAGPEIVEDTTRNSLHHFGTLIQTDAKLNLGTSGGALLNLQGEMIGLTTSAAATAGYELSAGYAVPVDDTFRRVVDTLKQGREVEYGFLGIGTDDLSPQQRRRGMRGMRIQSVLSGTPASRVDLQEGDLITHINGSPIGTADELILRIGSLPPGSNVDLSIQRGSTTLTRTVELAKNRVSGRIVTTADPPRWRGLTVDYATAAPQYLTRLRRKEIDPDGCVLVRDVAKHSEADQQGIKPNTFISHVDGRRVTRPDQFHQQVAGKRGPVRIQLVAPPGEGTRVTIPPPSGNSG